MDKRLIAERFARARNTYGREARVQQQVAEKMMTLLEETMKSLEARAPSAARWRHVVELGCGTGSYSRLLAARLHPESLLLNDLCPEMEECLGDLTCREGTRFLPGDAENLTFPAGTELITSCSTLQWFARPDCFFARCHEALPAGGLLAFSTFGGENMHEIRRLTGHGLDYPSVGQLSDMMLASDFEVLHAGEERAVLSFPDPVDVLRHLRQTGVTGTEKRVWTRGRLEAFRNGYRTLFGNPQGEGVTLTYHPIYIIARNRK